MAATHELQKKSQPRLVHGTHTHRIEGLVMAMERSWLVLAAVALAVLSKILQHAERHFGQLVPWPRHAGTSFTTTSGFSSLSGAIVLSTHHAA